MTLTKEKLKFLIGQIIKEQLAEAFEDEDEKESKKAYKRFLDLSDKHGIDFWILKTLGPEAFREMLDLRDAAEDFDEFLRVVGPGEYDRLQGRYKPVNNFRLKPEIAYVIYNKKYGTLPVSKLVDLMDEFEELKDRFKTIDKTSTTDRIYGRQRKQVLDTVTGKIVDDSIDKKGSLGT